ncbi:UvrB/UvrC motif-containing protein [Miniphocaeibacter massiliensis]|uniref:UvrB/UvrC motif-containing protein n=1 Tax=Miniphocaeibacter massiliensis TaxID=2041841 RepID=UPI000C1B91C7|nr:UvrB/UvrC motif-containing protein [Miniphocaeibacter massiliensis]
MKCDKCNNEANFEMHLIGNNGKKTVRLCKDCYMKYMEDFSGFGEIGEENFKHFQDILSDLIGSILDKNIGLGFDKVVNSNGNSKEDTKLTEQKDKKICSNCGVSLSEIIKTGKLGCSQCYEDFKSEIGEILNQTQGILEHKGKVPEKYEGLIIIKKEIEKKEEELKDSIMNEDYEKAALIRDEIKELKTNLDDVDGQING